MQRGRGGMGSHKHAISGYASKSPALRHYMKREAEKDIRPSKGKIIDGKSTVRELLEKRK